MLGTIIMLLVVLRLAFMFRIAKPGDIRVVDGDSLCIKGVHCRIVGLDAPEWNQPQGPASTAEMRRILAGRRVLVLTTGTDLHGRNLVRVWTSEGPASVAFRMVARGHAFADGLLRMPAMVFARIARRGMWDRSHDLQHPALWRRN